MLIERKIRNKIEYAFYNYDSIKAKGAEYIVDLAERGLTASYNRIGDSKKGYQPAPHGSGVSNPTEQAVMSSWDMDYRWCRVVEKTRERFAQDIGKPDLIELRYNRRCSFTKLQVELYISQATLCNWLDEILTYAAMIALQLGLIQIIENPKGN